MKKIPKKTFFSLTIRAFLLLLFSAILGSMTYTKLDLIFTTIYISFTALVFFFPPIWSFFTDDI